MKARLLIAAVLMFFANTSFGQMQTSDHSHQHHPRGSLTIFGGYTFQDKVSFSNSYGYIKEAAHWGLSAEFFMDRLRTLELLYQRMDTHAPLYDGYFGTQLNHDNDKAGLNYIMIGGVNYIPASPTVMPYGGINLGVCVVTNKEDYTATKFAIGGKLGVKIKASPVVGIKLQAQLLSVVQGAGGGFYVGTGGSGYGVSTYSTVLQFGFTGGLSFDF
ncbi:porin family protein [Taibaiella soli]|uniref:Porin family protein n=1 Tax=Taibaiella soli TaxID=1649169 RepID=A0A2W2BZH9_9BACT|nr:porin family protein [Taibaiella soli]PZF73253.1 porin family protein [Taibaiella soli]